MCIKKIEPWPQGREASGHHPTHQNAKKKLLVEPILVRLGPQENAKKQKAQ
jgi:hypothetical protein